MNESEYKSIMTAFKQRADEHGYITRDAFIESVGSTSHPELAGKIFDVFDKDGSNTMDVCHCSLSSIQVPILVHSHVHTHAQLKEYLLMCGMTRAGTVEQRLEASFDLFDANGDGVLSKEEVRNILIMLVQQKMALARFQSTGRKTSPEHETLDARTLASIDRVVDTTFANVDTDKVCFPPSFLDNCWTPSITSACVHGQKNGTIDKKEFTQGFATHPEICSFFKQF